MSMADLDWSRFLNYSDKPLKIQTCRDCRKTRHLAYFIVNYSVHKNKNQTL